MPAVQETVERVRRIDVDQYRYGFETLIESDKAPKGLSEETVRTLVARATRRRQLGILGEERVNVLELNLALDEQSEKAR